MVYTLRFFSSKCSLFHNSNLFGSCVIHILYTGCAKIKKKSGAKRLTGGQACVSSNKRDTHSVVGFIQEVVFRCCVLQRKAQHFKYKVRLY